MEPPIQYTKTSDGINIAYYEIGSGPPLVWMSPSILSNIEDEWNLPAQGHLIRAAARSFTVVRYDPRGCGEQTLKGIDEPIRIWAVRRD